MPSINDKSAPMEPEPAHVADGFQDSEKAEVIINEDTEQYDKPRTSSLTHGYVPETAPRYTKEEEAAVIRKLDLHLIPLLFVLYSLSVLDRTNLGNARIAGMAKDIDLAGRRYDWLGTIFYISYILSQPLQIGWKAFPPHIWAAFCVLSWGMISTLQAAASSWGGLMACRFLLATVEAGYGPGVPLFLSYFYPREKLGFRTGIFLAGSAAANAYGSTLAYGISQAKGGIGPWRILFIVEGVPTCILAIGVYFWLPDRPDKAKFLTERQKEIAVDISLRQPGDRTGNAGVQWKQILGALLDWRSYPPAIMYFGCSSSFASLPLFVPTIISEMGSFTTVQANGLNAPPYVLTFLAIIISSFISDRYKIRGPFVAGGALLSAIGFIIQANSSTVGVRYFGIFLAPLVFVSIALILSWVANNHATESKRAGGLTILATVGQCGTLVGTNMFPIKDKPFYRKGMWVSCAMSLLVFVFACVHMVALHMENKKRDKKYGKDRDVVHLEHPTEYGNDAQFRFII